MKTFVKFTLLLVALFHFNNAAAQLVANAGNDTTVCAGALITLGGNPTASGGTPPYQYLWSTGSTGENFFPRVDNNITFSVTVTDFVGATAIDSITVTVVSKPNISSVVSNVSCNGINDGAIDVSIIGGTPNFTYAWNNSESIQDLVGLTTGTYSVTVTDVNGCSVTDQFFINGASNIAFIYNVIDAGCNNGINNGSIFISASGSSGNGYEYSIDNGINFSSVNPITDLPANNYQVIVRDGNGCTSTAQTVTINQNSNTPIIITLDNLVNISCNGGFDGAIDLTVSGGTPNYTYQWSNGVSAQGLSNLSVGNYFVTVTDANQCTTTELFTIAEPSPINLSATVTNVSCNGGNDGSIDLTVSGGTPNYTYAWNTLDNTEDLSNLSAGNYFVTVTDANNCTAIKTFTVNEPSPINLSATVTNISCNGSNDGAIDLTLNSPFYIYSWTASPFSWNSFSTTEDITNLASGWYYVEVLDTNQCYSQDSFLVTEPSPIIISSTVTNVSCNGGQNGVINLTVSGGGGFNYIYTWDNGATTEDITDLAIGTYQVTVTDQNGCIADTIASVTEPAPFTAQIISSTGGIVPDTLSVLISGGIPPYLYQWSDASTTETVINYCYSSSVYAATITDGNGCYAVSNNINVQYTCINNCVWPGDADNNGIADNNDLLPIGLAYGTNGFGRCFTAIDWKAVYADDWADTLASGTNYKHIDCDGDGSINADDTLAIIQNFGFTHAKNNQSQAWRMNAPALLVDLTPQTVIAGQILTANLILGDINIPATDVYGLAFTLNYDALVVDSTQTAIVFDNSWLGNATDKISIAKDLPQQGQIKCAVTRIDKNTRSGSGIIGKASFIITTDNINGKNQLAYYNMNVWISDLTVIDNNGQVLIVNEGSDSTQVEYEPLAINEALINEMKIYPNPAQNEVLITVSDKLLSGTLTLVDTEGKILFSKTIDTLHNNIPIATFANGVYYVKIVTETGVVTKRLAIVK